MDMTVATSKSAGLSTTPSDTTLHAHNHASDWAQHHNHAHAQRHNLPRAQHTRHTGARGGLCSTSLCLLPLLQHKNCAQMQLSAHGPFVLTYTANPSHLERGLDSVNGKGATPQA